MPKWATTMPQVASGVRRRLRPNSGAMLAGDKPGAERQARAAEAGSMPGAKQKVSDQRRAGEQDRRRDPRPQRPAVAPPAQQRADRHQRGEQQRQRPGDGVEIRRADRQFLAASAASAIERIERADEDDAEDDATAADCWPPARLRG